MNYELLEDDELLGLALDAVSNTRDEDAVVLLKVLVNRNPAHAMGQYLLFAMARFQLGQLLLVKGDAAGAVIQFK